jgi:glutaconate CoA-transferase subunit A
MDFSPAEWMACAMAQELKDGDSVAIGLATTLPFCGAMLAKRTHAPNLKIAYVVPHGTMSQPRRASLLWNEKLTMERVEKLWSFTESVLDWIPREQPKEFFRPAQIDARGQSNNIRVGTLRLPGAAGIPDVTRYHRHVYYYIPNHSPKVFVPEVDVVSGISYRPLRVITNLALLAFDQVWFVTQLRPSVTREDVRAATGFELRGPSITFTPNPKHLELLRNEIDPLGTRDLELLSGEARLQSLERIIRAEQEPARRP